MKKLVKLLIFNLAVMSSHTLWAQVQNCSEAVKNDLSTDVNSIVDCKVSNQIVSGKNIVILLENFEQGNSSADVAGVTLSVYEWAGTKPAVLISKETGLGEKVLPINFKSQQLNLVLADLNKDKYLDWAIRTVNPSGSSLLIIQSLSAETDSIETFRPYVKSSGTVVESPETDSFVSDAFRDVELSEGEIKLPSFIYMSNGQKIPSFDIYKLEQNKFVKIK